MCYLDGQSCHVMKPRSRLRESSQTRAAGSSTATRPSYLAERVSQCQYFFCNANAAYPRTLALPCGGWERCLPDYVVRRASFEYFALEYVAEGHGQLIWNDQLSELHPGSLFGYAPGTPHLIRTSADQPLLKYFVDFTGSRAQDIFSNLPFDRSGIAWLSKPNIIHELFQQIVETGQEPEGLSQKLCSSLFEVLLLRIEQNAMRPEEAKCRAFETYIRASYELGISFRCLRSPADLASKVGITPAYLAKLFHRYSNTSPHKALMSMKMAEAASLLVGMGASVKHTAEQVGFSDPYHFSRVFKSYYGSAPAHFRMHPRSSADPQHQ